MRAAWTQSAQTLLLLTLCCSTQATSIGVWSRAVSAAVQGSALLSVDIACSGTPTVRWAFTSARGQQTIAVWTLGGSANVTQTYEGRVQAHPNGSLTISDLRLQDSGYYIITVTDTSGSSKDTGLVLRVTEELYEDVWFLAGFVIVLAALAGFLMLCMWLLNKLHRFIKAWRNERRLPEHSETELQPL